MQRSKKGHTCRDMPLR
ncbi:unnamed protein product, partial [Allacma fusca]